jgi:hypothetical protein
MQGDPLPIDNHVARYCRPGDFDRKKDRPKVTAFQRSWKESSDPDLLSCLEPYLSVNWLEIFPVNGRDAQVECVRLVFERKKYEVRPNGRFVVLNVGAAKAKARQIGATCLQITHMPTDVDPTHSGIDGYPNGYDDLDLATELRLLVTDSDIFLAIP